MTASDGYAWAMLITQFGFIACSVVFLASNIDDAVIDVIYMARWLWRRLFVYRRHPRFSLDALHAEPEQPVALMFPAWQEAEVIGAALENLISTLDYANFQVFIGTYPNDPATAAEVKKLQARFANIHHVVTPLPGPTCKADCLNAIIRGIAEWERQSGVRFEIVVMHDAEDIVHPLSLKLFNLLIPRFDLVQIPVIALERPWHDLTGGHYMHEFAEVHSKDLIVREFLSGVVPGAGVGTGYSRRALELDREGEADIFNIGTLTEDYDFSFRLRDAGLKQIFARMPARRTVRSRSWLTGRETAREVSDVICTREYFPNRFAMAVRQKARWVIGISFQSWRRLGWSGRWADRYLFCRDRKMILLGHATPVGLLISLLYGAMLSLSEWDAVRFPASALLADGDPFWWVVGANVGLLVFRLAQRHFWSWRYYGFGVLPSVIPCYLWGVVVNYAATLRAWRIFLDHLLTGKTIGWDKTAHEFPDSDTLHLYRRRIGDLLVERKLLSPDQLAGALRRQGGAGRPLGELLVEDGLLEEEQLLEVLGRQLRVEGRDIDAAAVPDEIVSAIPTAMAKAWRLFPVGRTAGGALLIACNPLPPPERAAAVEAAAGGPVAFCLATRGDLAFTIFRRFEAGSATQGSPIGERLVAAGVLTADELREALKEQRRRYRPLGRTLLDSGAMTAAEIETAVGAAADAGVPLGRWLLDRGRVGAAEVERALEASRRSYLRLGEAVAALGLVPAAALPLAEGEGASDAAL